MSPRFEQMLYILPIVLVSLSVHEFAHGWVAFRFGDNTAKRLGRLTLNPLAHIDMFGTVFLPALALLSGLPLFGYAKPVPVDMRNLKPHYLGMALVAAAGPFSNLLLAGLSASIFYVALRMQIGTPMFFGVLDLILQLNVVLCIFNLLPFPPLDGFRIVQSVFRLRYTRFIYFIERFGILVLFALIYLGALSWMWKVIQAVSISIKVLAKAVFYG